MCDLRLYIAVLLHKMRKKRFESKKTERIFACFDYNSYFCIALTEKICKSSFEETRDLGEMVEWSITVVLKTTVLRGTGGSNPSLSATNLDYQGFMNKAPKKEPN